MSEIIPFHFESHDIRVQVDDQGRPWFNANDVCDVLEFGNPRQAIETHVDLEDVQKLDTLTTGGQQRQNHVNESGLYALIIGSTKDAAKRFKRWVTHDVLPAIRRTGAYTLPETQPGIPIESENPDLLGAGFTVFKNRLKYQGQDVQQVAAEFNACMRAAALAARHLGITDQDWIIGRAVRNLRLTTGIDMRVLTGARTLIPYSDDLLSPAEIGHELGFSKNPERLANLLLAEIGYQEPGHGSARWTPMGAGLPLCRSRMTEFRDDPAAPSGVIQVRPVLYWQPVVLDTLSEFLRDLATLAATQPLTKNGDHPHVH